MDQGHPPPPNVLRAFGVSEAVDVTPLAGRIAQTAWRAGELVLKPVQEANPGEGDWVAEMLDAIVEDGFRVAKPIRSGDGRWVADGWTSWRWVAGEHQRHDWQQVVAAGRAFHAAVPGAIADRHLDVRPDWLDTRSHRWAVAEAVVWHGTPLPTGAAFDVPEVALWERARSAGPPLTLEERRHSQVVHGDIAGNVLCDGVGPPTLIDVSPGWRPATSVDAQIVVEAVAWYGGDESLLDEIASRPGGRADIARACGFRLMCGFQALTIGMRFNPEEIRRFGRIIDAVEA